MVECLEQYVLLHESSMLSKLVEYKAITADVANDTKFQYSNFLGMFVKENRQIYSV